MTKLYIIPGIDILNNTIHNNFVACAPRKKMIDLKFYYSTRNKTLAYAEKPLFFDIVTKTKNVNFCQVRFENGNQNWNQSENV